MRRRLGAAWRDDAVTRGGAVARRCSGGAARRSGGAARHGGAVAFQRDGPAGHGSLEARRRRVEVGRRVEAAAAAAGVACPNEIIFSW